MTVPVDEPIRTSGSLSCLQAATHVCRGGLLQLGDPLSALPVCPIPSRTGVTLQQERQPPRLAQKSASIAGSATTQALARSTPPDMLIRTEPMRSQLLAADAPCVRAQHSQTPLASSSHRGESESRKVATATAVTRVQCASQEGLCAQRPAARSTAGVQDLKSVEVCALVAPYQRKLSTRRYAQPRTCTSEAMLQHPVGGHLCSTACGHAADSKRASNAAQPAHCSSGGAGAPLPRASKSSASSSTAQARLPQALPPDCFSLQHRQDARPAASASKGVRDAGLLGVLLSSFRSSPRPRPSTAPAARRRGDLDGAARQRCSPHAGCRASMSGADGAQMRQEAMAKHTASGCASGGFHARGWSRARTYSSTVRLATVAADLQLPHMCSSPLCTARRVRTRRRRCTTGARAS